MHDVAPSLGNDGDSAGNNVSFDAPEISSGAMIGGMVILVAGMLLIREGIKTRKVVACS